MNGPIKLPDGYVMQGEPTHLDTEDCMGCSYSHWRVSAVNPDGRVVLSTGGSKNEAVENLVSKCVAEAAFKAQPELDRLEQLVERGKKQGHFYDQELVEVLSILVAFVKRNSHGQTSKG